jgi:aminopeptidase N
MIASMLRVSLVLSVAALASGAARAEEAYPRGLLPGGVTPTHYSLELSIDPREDGFTGTAGIDVTVDAPTRSIWMHGLDLREVEARVEAGGRTIAATYVPVDTITGVVRLDLEEEFEGAAILHFNYRGSYREGPEGLFLVETGGARYVFSQLQAIDARRVFPGFDQPGFKTPFDIAIVTTGDDIAISNTPVASTELLEDGRRRQRFEATLPLPTYLLAFAVGPLDVVEAPPLPANEIRSRPVPLRGIATRGNGPRLSYALANTADMVERLERYFGMAFPYPKLDLIAAPSLGFAMENAGAIVYDESILLLDGSAPTSLQRSFGVTHAHELAHQWFGDVVTPWWWEDTWLNESFATWLGEKVAAQWRPSLFNDADLVAGAFRVMDADSRVAGRPVREPIDDNLRISSTFDGLTYSKGGGLLRMFESFIGEEAFREGVRLHVQRHLHGVATSDEFFAALAEASRQPVLVDSFRGFVNQPGVPIISVSRAPESRQLLLSQKRYAPICVVYPDTGLWKVPVCATVFFADDVPEKVCSLLTEVSGRMDLPPGTVAVMPNSQGAGYYRFSMAPDQLEGLVDNVDALPATEALALVDSVGAAFRAGELPFDSLVWVARRLATHPERKVALALSDPLSDIQERWLDAGQRAAMAALIVDLYAPVLEGLGLDPSLAAYASEDANRRLLRLSLARLLAFSGNHRPTLELLAEAAGRSLEDPAAVDPEYLGLAWGAGVRLLGEPFAREMMARVTSPDAVVRDAAAAALGTTLDPATSTEALELAVKPGVGVTEMGAIVFQQLGQPETREPAWTWLLGSLDRIRDRLPGFAQEYVYAMPSSFCDAGARTSVAGLLEQALAERRVSALRSARTLESIDLCIAQKAALGGGVAAVLQGGGAPPAE